MIKKHEFNYLGMSKDSSRDLQSDKYFDAENIRVTAEDDKSKMAITNEKGNEIVFSIPLPVLNFAQTRIEYTVGFQQKLYHTLQLRLHTQDVKLNLSLCQTHLQQKLLVIRLL